MPDLKRSITSALYSASLDALTATRSDEIIYSRCNIGQRGEREAERSGELELSSRNTTKLHINGFEEVRIPLQRL